MTALRRAVFFCSTLACDWSAQEIERLSGAAPAAVRSYLGRLAVEGVLIRQGERFRAGPGIRAWRAKEPKTRPGGHSRAYLEAKALRADLAQRDWEAKGRGMLTGQERTGPDSTRQEGTGVDNVTFSVTPEGSDMASQPLTTVAAAALMLNTSEKTVMRMLKARKLPKVVVGARLVRIPTAALEAHINAKIAQAQAAIGP